MLILYACTLFVGGTLLFLVQPMFAKMVLPLLGGSPSVWNTAMLFYQVALLLSYLYAHGSRRWLSRSQQVVVHLVLLLLPLAVLPIAIPAGWAPPSDANPIPWMLRLLTVAIGLPFCVVATTSPLMQAWFSRLQHPASANPYPLYVASNVGSMLALVSYPLLIEPVLPLGAQSRYWAFGYSVFVLLSAGCAAVVWKSRDASAALESPAMAVGSPIRSNVPVTTPRRMRWLLLAFVPSSLMLSVTMYLSTNIAPIPLMWAAILAVYLLTFILAFASRPLVPRQLVSRVMPIGVLLLLLTMLAPFKLSISVLIVLHVVVFFVVALACHGALADDAPDATRVTEFYLWLSIGGALGGIFNAIVAPMLFSSVLEYPIVLALACLIVPAYAEASDQRAAADGANRHWLGADRFVPMDAALPVLLAAGMFGMVVLAQRLDIRAPQLRVALTAALPVVLCFTFARRPVRFALGVAVLVAVNAYGNTNPRELLAVRSFFGISRVVLSTDGAYTQMVHGTTLHGMQARDPARRREALAYYFRNGPIGQLISSRQRIDAVHNVAVVGLGSGALACYAQPGQRWTFYEIDPAVKRIALDPRWFTFLRDCAPGADIVLGDARLSLVCAPDAAYDMIILDAYSSDAIPVHLITREALALYRAKLAPRGTIVFHISNLYFSLAPVVSSLAADAGWQTRRMHDSPIAASDEAIGKWPSEWIAVARDTADFGVLTQDPRWVRDTVRSATKVWTDDYSSTLSALKRK